MKGLVLEGGASKGAYLIGVVEAIKEANIAYDSVVGTSVGAINGAMIAQEEVEKASELWATVEYDDVFEVDGVLTEELFFENNPEFLPLKIQSIFDIRRDGGLDISPFKKMLDEYIDEDKIRKSPIDFGITTINISQRRVEQPFLKDMKKGSIKSWVLASAYMPIFKKEKIFGDYYLDGCFYDNLPWRMLDKDPEDLIIIKDQGRGIVIPPPKEALIIEPSERLQKTMDFHYSKTRDALELGYLDGLKAFDLALGEYYFIEKDGFKDKYNLLAKIENMAKDYGVERRRLYKWEDFLFRIYQDISFFQDNKYFYEKKIIRKYLNL